jgi:glycosyltransferase involved in cell wall biosynthesis
VTNGIAFLVPTPPPVVPTAEAYQQEIQALCSRFGGRRFDINPNRYLPRGSALQLPRPLFGFLEWPRLRIAAKTHSIYQIYSPTLYPYPILRLLGRPVVYTLTGSASASIDAKRIASLSRHAALTVPDRKSFELVREAGVTNAHQVRPGIDTSRFTFHPQSLGRQTRLLMASAPWTEEQFRSKGVDALLDAVEIDRSLQVTLLWRGVLTAEARRRVSRRRLEDRVEIIDRLEEVDRHLSAVHATIVLATRGDLVKAFPHSLIESLAAGKPVLVSREIPMAEYVEETHVGIVVEQVTTDALLEAIARLRENYVGLQQQAAVRRGTDFRLEGMLSSFAAVYSAVSPARTLRGVSRG